MPRQPIRIAAATAEISLGLPAVVLFAVAVTYLFDSSDIDNKRGILIGIGSLLGGALFFIWLYARSRRRLLITLIICSGILFAVTTMIAVVLYRPSRFDSLRGVWGAAAAAGLDVLLWLVITILSVVELRLARSDEEPSMPAWAYLPSIVAPLALIVALTIMIITTMPRWLINLNSAVSDVKKAQAGQGSELSGGIRWTRDLTGEAAVATSYGIAVPVQADGSHSAGIIMIDVTTGEQLWRYQLHGAVEAPRLQVTDNGHGIVVDLNESSDQLIDRTYVLDSDTGAVRGIWPINGSGGDVDPPVLFHHVAQGANSVVRLSLNGNKLWTYHPNICADPRSVSSTPHVIVVRARRCGHHYNDYEDIGLDARTGDRLWTQPVPAGSSESGPDETVVRTGYRLELTGSDLIRRDLANGRITWKATAGGVCHRRFLSGAGQTAFLGVCNGSTDKEPNRLVGYAMQTGKQTVDRDLHRPISALAGVDGQSALAVTTSDTSCLLERVGKTSTSKLWSLPTAKARTYGVVADCRDATILTVGESRVLQIRIRDLSAGGDSSYRLVGLR